MLTFHQGLLPMNKNDIVKMLDVTEKSNRDITSHDLNVFDNSEDIVDEKNKKKAYFMYSHCSDKTAELIIEKLKDAKFELIIDSEPRYDNDPLFDAQFLIVLACEPRIFESRFRRFDAIKHAFPDIKTVVLKEHQELSLFLQTEHVIDISVKYGEDRRSSINEMVDYLLERSTPIAKITSNLDNAETDIRYQVFVSSTYEG
jgi:hypothetical protein